MTWESPESVKATLGPLFARMAAKMAATPSEPPSPDPDEAERRARLLAEAGVPLLFRRARFATSTATPALDAARQFVAHDLARGRCLVLAGTAGTGKTHAAVCVLDAARGVARRFRYVGEAAGVLLDGGRGRSDLLDLLTHIPLLVLDDLGVEAAKTGGHFEAFLDRVIYARESERLATIITTNLTPADLVTRYSERIIDRLRAWGDVVALDSLGLRRLLGDESEPVPEWVTER